MILFVGLGNPGEKYQKTPHNAGFRAMEKLRRSLGNSSVYNVGDWNFDRDLESFLCLGKADNEIRFVLAKPLTFMNKSGRSVRNLIEKFKIDIDKELVLFYDDLDIKLGDIKIAKGKHPKNHKGLISIFNLIKNQNFLSARLGVDNREDRNIPGEEYVLNEYSQEELDMLDKSIAEGIRKIRLNISI